MVWLSCHMGDAFYCGFRFTKRIMCLRLEGRGCVCPTLTLLFRHGYMCVCHSTTSRVGNRTGGLTGLLSQVQRLNYRALHVHIIIIYSKITSLIVIAGDGRPASCPRDASTCDWPLPPTVHPRVFIIVKIYYGYSGGIRTLCLLAIPVGSLTSGRCVSPARGGAPFYVAFEP